MKSVASLIIILGAVTSVRAMTVEEYVKAVQQNNKVLQSYQYSEEAANDRVTAGDLGLSPIFTAAYSVASDKSLPSAVADQREVTSTNLGLSKKFSSGTSVSLTAETYRYDFTKPVALTQPDYNNGRLGLSLQQSLWKDSFGAATRLRRERESLTNQYEVLGTELKRRGSLVQMEADYWDFIVAREDLKLKIANLDRAKKLESWTKNRVYNGISDTSDLLQIQALVAARELALLSAKDQLEAMTLKIRENLSLQPEDKTPELDSELTQIRPFLAELKAKPNVVQIEQYLAGIEAKVKSKIAEETSDALRPDLALIGKYYTSSYDLDYQTMQNNLTKTDRPVTYVGLSLSWMFGSDAVAAQNAAARKDAMAAQYRAAQALTLGRDAWREQLRKYEIAKSNVETIEKIAKLQSERAKQQQIKFSKGRTITSEVVTAETDSAEAEVNYLRAKSGLRKLEAAGRLYISVAE